jgi:cell division protein ZapA
MSNVTLQIGGRSYTVACAAGEEAHVASLGQLIDDKVKQVGGASLGEVRQLLFAALLLADELHEARKGTPSAAAPSHAGQGDHADQLEALAARLETVAQALEA